MADQFEENIKLTADVTEINAAKNAANANLDSIGDHARKAAEDLNKVADASGRVSQKVLSINVNQASQRGLNQLAARQELAARSFGLDAGSKALLQNELALNRAAGDMLNTNKILAARSTLLAKIAEDAKKAQAAQGFLNRNTAAGRGFLAVKDLFEGRTSYAQVEAATAVSKLGSTGAIVGGVSALALVGIAVAAGELALKQAEAAKETQNLGIRLGVTSGEAYKLQAEAKLAGVDIGSFTSFMRTLSRGLVDGGEEGKAAAAGLRAIGVEGRDASGNLKPTVELFHEIAAGLKGVDTATAEAKLTQIGGRGALELLPFLQGLDKTDAALTKIGFDMKSGVIDRLAEAHDKIELVGVAVDLLKAKVAEKIVIAVEFVTSQSGLGVGPGDISNFAQDVFSSTKIGRLITGRQTKQEAANVFNAPTAVSPVGPDAQNRLNQSIAEGTKLLIDYNNKTGDLLSLQSKLAKDQEALRVAEAASQPGERFKEIAQSLIATTTASRNRVEADKEAIRILQERPAAERAAADAAIDAQRKYQTELFKSTLLAQGLTESEITGRVAVKEALDKFTDSAAKSKQAGEFTPAVRSAQLNTLVSQIKTAQLLGEDADRAAAEKKRHEDFATATEGYEKESKLEIDLQRLKFDNAQAIYAYTDKTAQDNRDRQIRAIENTDAKTLQAKVAFEVQKGNIEAAYLAEASSRQQKALEDQNEQDKALLKQKFLTEQGTLEGFDDFALAKDDALNKAKIANATTAAAEIQRVQEDAQIKAAQATTAAYTSIFDSIKSKAGDLFDAFSTKGKSAAQAIGDLFKKEFLSLGKEIFSTQIAKFATGSLTGTNVSLVPSTPRVGILGKIEDALGLGVKPSFKSPLDSTITNSAGGPAVRVEVTNPGDISSVTLRQQNTTLNPSFSLGGGGNRSISLGGAGRSPIAATLALALGLGGGGGVLSAGTALNSAARPGSAQATFGALSDSGGLAGEFSTPGGIQGGFGGVGSTGGFAPGSITGDPQLDQLILGGGNGSSGGIGSLSLPGGLPTGGAGIGTGIARQGGFAGLFGGGKPNIFGALAGGLLGGLLGKSGGTGAAIGSAAGGGIIGALSKFKLSNLAGFFGGGGGNINIRPGVAIAGGFGSITQSLASLASSPAAGALGAGLFGLGIKSAAQYPQSAIAPFETTSGGALLGARLGSRIPGLGLIGGAEAGAGIGLATNGLQRGGFIGLGETTAGGAITGAALGSTILPGIGTLAGAAIGAGVGLLSGVIRLFVKTKPEQVHDAVQSLYGVDIKQQSVLNQIAQLTDTKYNRSVFAAIRGQDVRNLIQQYAEETGQKATGINNIAQAASFVNTASGLAEQATYFNGQAVLPGQTASGVGYSEQSTSAFHTIQTPTYGGVGQGNMTLSLDADATLALLSGNAINTMQQNPRAVASAAGNGISYGNTQRASAGALINPAFLTS